MVSFEFESNFFMTHARKLSFSKESFKNKLRDTLKEFKIGIMNEDGVERSMLQSDQILEQLKVTYGHATSNMLKRK
jgi:hypothetical protein